ncbi:MAG: carboxypeptidase-like regulatory domain-containing protein [Salibacteraceae bacterium]
MKNIGLLIGGLILTATTFGNGIIKGLVTETMDGKQEPVPFANVFLLGTTTGGMTDFDGNFQFSAPVGNHKVVVSFTGYVSDTLSVDVQEGTTHTLNFKMRQKSFSLKAVQVIAKANRESESALLMERKNAEGIEEKIGAQELTKKGAGDVQEGLAKMSGVSQAGAGSILVRGLGDRYNNAYLNGIPLPSPDPDKKVIPLDIIPTSVVQSLTVAKTFTPNQLGDVSGASININTKDYPEEKTFNVYGGLGTNTQTMGKSAMSYEGGKLDYFGFDDGTRSIPSELNAEFNNLDNPSKDLYNSNDSEKNPSYPGTPFAKNFNPRTINAPLNSKFGFNLGNFYGKKDNSKGFGFLVLGSFENKTKNLSGVHRVVNAQDAMIIDYTYNSTVQSTRTSALGSAYYRFNTNNNIKFNTLFVNLSDNNIRETDGYHWDYDNLGEVFSRRYTWTQNKLWSNQLIGNHKLLHDKLNVDWNVAYQVTGSNEPDRRQLIWTHQPGDDRKDYQFFTDNLADQHRYYMYLTENEYNFAANAKYILKSDSNKAPVTTISGGYLGRIKQRNQDFKFYSHNLKGLSPSNGFESVDANNPDAYINDENHEAGYYWQREESRPESATEGSLFLHSGYATLDHRFNEKWFASAGVRIEKSYQEIRYRKQSSPLDPEFVESEVIDTINFLPMLSAKFSPNKKSSIRFVASQTVTRPNFKELAPFQYREFFGGKVTQGNPLLKNSNNTNVDIRFEKYPNSGDLYSVTVFGRMIDQPIEQVTVGSASGILLTYQNAKSAQAFGVEFEFIKKFRNFVSSDSPLRNLAFGANFSYIYSTVEIDVTQGVTANNPNRQLQGASPILANADLTYEKRFTTKYKTSATISYNYFSRRLYAVGRQNIGDAYEQAINTLNFTWKNDIGSHWQFNVSANNLLNPEIQVEQESTQGNANTIVDSYQRGIDVGATLVYKIFAQ